MMGAYLDEDMIGTHSSELVFPHLLLCMGVICQLDNGRLVGCHISSATTEDGVLAELRRQIESDPGNPTRLYMIADFSRHFLHTKNSFTVKARALGYTGNILIYNTESIVDGDGAYARVVSTVGSSPCSVYVMRDQDARPYPMVSGSKYNGGGDIVLYQNGTVRQPPFIKTGDGAPRPGNPVDQSSFKVARCN